MSRPLITSGFKRRGADQRVEHHRGPEIGEEAHLLAQAQQAALGPHRERQLFPFRPADRAEQHRIGRLGVRHGLVGDRRALGVVGAAADQTFAGVEAREALLVEPFDDAMDLAHHFGADAVARQDQEFLVRRAHCAFAHSQGCVPRGSDPRTRRWISLFCSVRPISSSPSSSACLRNVSISNFTIAAVGPRDGLRLEVDGEARVGALLRVVHQLVAHLLRQSDQQDAVLETVGVKNIGEARRDDDSGCRNPGAPTARARATSRSRNSVPPPGSAHWR